MARPLKPRRPFTQVEIDAARALRACRFTPGHPHKAFARNLEFDISSPSNPGITVAQAEHMRRLVHTYRRQIPDAVREALQAEQLPRADQPDDQAGQREEPEQHGAERSAAAPRGNGRERDGHRVGEQDETGQQHLDLR